MNVQTLENHGYQVQISHGRIAAQPYPDVTYKVKPKFVQPHGGETLAYVSKDGRAALGVAVCSESDNFNRKTGVDIAIVRALRRLHSK